MPEVGGQAPGIGGHDTPGHLGLEDASILQLGACLEEAMTGSVAESLVGSKGPIVPAIDVTAGLRLDR